MWYHRYRGLAYVTLTTLCFFLLIALLNKHGYVSGNTLKDNKDALASIASVGNIIALTFGSVLGYYRFFNGRTFSVKAELNLSVEAVSLEDRVLHSIILHVKNVGSVTIWQPNVDFYKIERTESGHEQPQKFDPHDFGFEDVGRTTNIPIIDAGSSVSFFGTAYISKAVPAVIYVAELTASSGDKWMLAKLVATKPNQGNS
jgi:hypothetical protein